MKPHALPAHQGEPVDPTLLQWISDKLHDLINLGPVPVVIIMGALIVSVPAAVVFFAVRSRRRAAR